MNDHSRANAVSLASVRRRGAVVLLALVSLVGLSACMVSFGGPNPDRVGAFDYDDDVVPMVDRVMREAIGPPSVAAFMELMAEGAATEAEIEPVLSQMTELFGEWSGEYSIDRHERPPDQAFAEFGPEEISLMEVYVDSSFDIGPVRVRLLFGDVDGSLKLIRWDVNQAD